MSCRIIDLIIYQYLSVKMQRHPEDYEPGEELPPAAGENSPSNKQGIPPIDDGINIAINEKDFIDFDIEQGQVNMEQLQKMTAGKGANNMRKRFGNPLLNNLKPTFEIQKHQRIPRRQEIDAEEGNIKPQIDKGGLKEGITMNLGKQTGPKLPEVRVMICIVSNSYINDFQVIQQLAPNQFVHIGRERISDPKIFQFDNNYYAIFRLKLQTQNPRPSIGIEWQERVRFSLTEARMQVKNRQVTFENYRDKGVGICSAIKLDEHQHNRAILYCHHYLTDRTTGKRDRGFDRLMLHEPYMARGERGQRGERGDNIQEMFDWLHIFTQNFARPTRSMSPELRQDEILRTLVDLPLHNESSARYLCYILYYLYRDEAYVYLMKSRMALNIEFPYHYRRPYDFVSLTHEWCQYGYTLMAYRIMLAKIQSKHDKILGSVTSMLIANMESQTPEVKYQIILETIDMHPYLLANEYTVSQFLKTSDIVSPIEFFNLATHFYRLHPIQSLKQPGSLTENCYLVLNFLNALLAKYTDLKKRSPEKLKKMLVQTREKTMGIRDMFIVKDSVLYSNDQRFVLYGQFLVRAERVLKQMAAIDPYIPSRIAEMSQKFYDEAVQQCFHTNPADIIPFYIQTPIERRQKDFLEWFFTEKQVMITLNDLKTIFFRCFANSSQKKDVPSFDNDYLVEKMTIVMKKVNYDTISLIETLNDVFKDIQTAKNKTLFLKYIEQILAVGDYKGWDADQALLKVARFNEEIKSLVFVKLCAYIQSSHNKEERDYLSSRMTNHSLRQKDLERIVQLLYLNEKYTEEDQMKEVWHSINKVPKLLKAYQEKYRKTNYKQILEKTCKKILDKDLFEEQFEQIIRNLEDVQSLIKKYIDIRDPMYKIKKEKDQYLSKLENMNQIFKRHQVGQTFEKDIQQANKLKEKIKTEKLNISLVIPQNYAATHEASREVLILMNLQIWDKKAVKVLSNVLEVRDRTVETLKKAFEEFKNRKMNFQTFYLMFPIQYLDQILKYCKEENLKDQVKVASKKTNLSYLEQLDRYCHAFDYLSEKIEKKVLDFKDYYVMTERLNKKDWNINVQQMLKIIDHTTEIFKKFDISPCSKNDQIAKIIMRSGESHQMFAYIETQTLDERNINDLKEYINDLENSILRLETVKQFETVVLYWNLVKQQNNLGQFFKRLRAQIIDKKWVLSQSIHNSYISIKLIEQKIDESANRETSFKYEIDKIFKGSFFIVERKGDEMEIKIVLDYELDNTLSQQKNNRIIANSIIDYKKIMNYKEKSLLLINDFEREKQNIDIKTASIIKILKAYFELYKILDDVQKGAAILIKYGYDPHSLEKKVRIENDDYSKVQQIAQFINTQSETWKREMKKMYEQSYLLTHFLGPELNHFADMTLKKVYNPSLEWIVGLNSHEFKQNFETLETRSLIKKFRSENPLDKIRMVDKIYSRFKNIKDKEIENRIMVNQGEANITLYTCKQQQFYCCLVDEKDKTEVNQVFYCQTETKPEEIEVFLNRARLRVNKRHYVIAVHNLNTEMQLYFCDLLNNNFLNEHKCNAKLSFIDSSATQKVYLHLCRPNLFNVEKITLNQIEIRKRSELIASYAGDTYILESERAGQGKTFFARYNQINAKRTLKYLPLAGNVSFTTVARRLRQLELGQNDSLIIQLGHIENKSKVEVFLYEMIMFRCFNFRGFMFFPREMTVYVQLENFFEKEKSRQYHIIDVLREYGGDRAKSFKQFHLDNLVFDPNSQQEKFTLTYLECIRNGMINQREIKFDEFLNIPGNAKDLVHAFFVEKLKDQIPTYSLYRKFMDMLFVTFKTFSEAGYFSAPALRESHRAFPKLGLNMVRIKFLTSCVNNALEFLKETITTNDFDKQENEGKQDFRDKLTKFPLLILPSYRYDSYQFVYMDEKDLPTQIKALLLSQQYKLHRELQKIRDNARIEQLFRQKAFKHMNAEKLEQQMYNILQVISGNNKLIGKVSEIKERSPALKRYSLTMDNFFKMCLIIQRALCRIPVVVMGQSGVGKTALTTFLVESILQEQLLCFNVHAGVNQQTIVGWADQIFDKAYQFQRDAQNLHRSQEHQIVQTPQERRIRLGNHRPSITDNMTVKDMKKGVKKLWVFFDQFNTTDELSYIKEMVIDRRFRGIPLPDNVIMVAACNPYRMKYAKKTVKAGIKKQDPNDDGLAFKVKPPNMSMIQFMWDYQQLREQELRLYISKILQEINFEKHDNLAKAITWTHEFFKQNVQISSISLRDVSRFKELYFWFVKHMPQKAIEQGLAHIRDDKTVTNFNYTLNRPVRAIVLALSFCYSLRFASSLERNRYIETIEEMMCFDKDFIKIVTRNQQVDYVNRLKSPGAKIALNFALRENVFTTLVCLMNKIPILIIGNPGSSKSLSTKMIASNFRGVNSTSQFCKKFPEINMIFFQGSESCTSKGVEAVFEKAIKSKEQFASKKKENADRLENCVLFDEIGLAEKSVHNPLKVLHSKLETNRKEIGFIGISNWELDAAKMSRFLILARANPDLQELQETSVQIYKSYSPKAMEDGFEFFKQLAKNYYKFLKEWDADTTKRQGFFGLRDFYSYVKYACEIIKREDSTDFHVLQEALAKSIQINFDGQKSSVAMFNAIAEVNANIPRLNPIEIVNENLQNKQSRCLLLIVKGDALIPIINESIKNSRENRRVVCIYGSTFKQDQQSQQYNLEMTSMIISHISRGNILTFKDINNSIQTSLYDLFNKSFYEIGQKKYCRIAVGANSNPKCFVHQNFNAIVYVDEVHIHNTDLAFLNRFEKHYLDLKSMISSQEQQIIDQIMRWIKGILNFRKEDSPMKQENYLVNSCVESIVTLIIKLRHEKDIIRAIKKKLLQNRTLDFEIAMKQGRVEQQKMKEINQLIAEEQNFRTIKEDIILYTYDQFLDMSEHNQLWNSRSQKIRLSEMKCERDLRKQIEKFFESQEHDTLHIHINYQKQSQHVNLVLYIANSMRELSGKTEKRLIVIVQLHRFSFITLGIEHINISYLHTFEQYFTEDLTSQGSTEKLLEINNCNALFETLKLENNLTEFVLETIKRFKFESIVPNRPQISEAYFLVCNKISGTPLFQEKALAFITRHLKKQRISYDVVLDNKEDMLQCSSVKEAIIRYMQEKIIQFLCQFMERLIINNFVFNFDPRSCLVFFKHMENIKILEEFIDKSEQKYQQMFRKFLDEYVMAKDKDSQKKFQRGVESNVVQVTFPTIFPLSCQQFKFIFKNKDKSAENNDQIQIFTSKLLEFSLSQEKKDDSLLNLNFNKALNLFAEKTALNSKANSRQKYSFWSTLNENTDQLSVGYIFDMLQYLCIATEISDKYVCKILDLIAWVFVEYNLEKKIMLLTMDRNFWACIFQILMISFKYEDHIVIQQFLEEQFSGINEIPISIEVKKSSMEEYNVAENELPTQLIKFGCNILLLAANFLQLKVNNVSHYGINKYLSFFKEISVPVRKMLTSYEQFGLMIDQNFRVGMKLVELFQKINKKQTPKLIEDFVITPEQGCYAKRIYLFIKELIQEQHIPAKIEILLDYLSFKIFRSWYQDQSANQNTKQCTECIEAFIQFANTYTYFANNSVFFLQTILQKFVDPQNSGFEKKMQALQQLLESDIGKAINKAITFDNNFSVAIGNFFSDKLRQDFKEIISKMKQQSAEDATIIQKYEKTFADQINSKHKTAIQQIFSIEFCKIYCLDYIQNLLDNRIPQTLAKVDNMLCAKSDLGRHLRIFMMKDLFARYKDMDKIRIEFFEKNRCEWVKHCKDLIEESQVQQCIIPPPINETSKVRDLVKKFRHEKYIPTDIFHEIVKTGSQSSEEMYEFINFIMIDFYTRTVPSNLVTYFKTEFAKREDYKSPEKIVERTFILKYMEHKVTDQILYTEQTTLEDFMFKQLPVLNILNIVISLRKNDCPLLEMFFNKSGKVPLNFEKFIMERFLIGGKQNPYVALLETMIEGNDRTPGYYKCSTNCHYFYSVGGRGNLGCQNVVHTSQCPFCGGIIGGARHGILDRANEGAKRVNLQDLQPACNEIRENPIMTIRGRQYQLIGYTTGNTPEQLKQEETDNNRVNIITKRLLYYIVYSMWYFLTTAELIPIKEISALLNIRTPKETTDFLFHSMTYFNERVLETLNITDKNQNLTWKLGIQKRIFNIILKYKNTLRENERGSLSLTSCWHRDKVERTFANEIIKYTGGREKQALIKQSRALREGFTLTKQDFVKQLGDFAVHLIEYKKMRVFKMIESEKWPSYKNMLKQYGPVLPNEHPVLAFLMNSEDSLRNVKNFKNIFMFITKVLKSTHFKITRDYAKTTTLRNFLNEYFPEDLDIMDEMQQFVQSWNQLAKKNYQLDYECTTADKLGTLPQVTSEDNLHIFLPDNKHLDNREGRKVIALLRVAAGQYNGLCKAMEDCICKIQEYHDISIFSTTLLNPTQVVASSNMLEYFDREINQYVKSYSCFSVEYGIAVPHYALDEIESLIVKLYYGCKYIDEDVKSYSTINFVGQLKSGITDIREHFKQRTLEQAGQKDFIDNFILKTSSRDVFYKTMKNIQGSLENIMIYYKNCNLKDISIGEFIKTQRIQGVCVQIQNEPFDALPLDTIVDLYETIEMSTFYQVSFLLDGGYSAAELTEQEKNSIEKVLQNMKKGDNDALPKYNDFRIAFYRLISRSLLLMERDENKLMVEDLAYVEFLWPLGVDIYSFYDQDFHQAFKIPYSKTGAVMKLVPAPRFEDEISKQKLLEHEKEHGEVNMQTKRREGLELKNDFKPTFKKTVAKKAKRPY